VYPPWKLRIPVPLPVRLELDTVPPLEASVPELTVIPPLRLKSAAPLFICSEEALSKTACDTLSPPIELCRVKA
jgi:hypothetical protein